MQIIFIRSKKLFYSISISENFKKVFVIKAFPIFIGASKIASKYKFHEFNWCINRNYENVHILRKIRILAGLIYLNIAALHHYSYSLLLYALRKSMLKKELIKKVWM